MDCDERSPKLRIDVGLLTKEEGERTDGGGVRGFVEEAAAEEKSASDAESDGESDDVDEPTVKVRRRYLEKLVEENEEWTEENEEWIEESEELTEENKELIEENKELIEEN